MTPSSVMVIGGSKGIGRALAHHYHEVGLAVLVTSRSKPPFQNITWIQHDVTEDEFPREATDWLLNAPRGRLVIQAAAQFGPVGPLDGVDLDRWIQALKVNLVGVARTLKATIPILTSEDRVIVFLGGGVGGPNMQPRATAYTTSKIAVAGLLESVGRDPDCTVPVIGVSPGAFPTDFTAEVLRTDPNVAGLELIAQVEAVRSSSFDISRLVGVLDALCGQEGMAMSGRLIAAQRDDLTQTSRALKDSPELFRLRRVDGSSVIAGASW